MKKWLMIACLLPSLAYAETPISEGNVKQENCGFPDINRYRFNSVNSGHDVLLKKKTIPAGKSVEVGDLLFYANIVSVDTRSYFEVDSDIQVIGNSWSVADMTVKKGTRLFPRSTVTGTGIRSEGYPIIGDQNTTSSWNRYLAVKDDGYLCSVIIAIDARDNATSFQDASTYQKSPLIKKTEETVRYDEAVSLTLVAMDAASATIDAKIMEKGKLSAQKQLQLDAMSGEFEIFGSMKIHFERKGKNKILITKVDEPDNYGLWQSNIKSKF